MTEQDKLIVQAAKLYDHDDTINSLILLIARLDKENEKLKADLGRIVRWNRR